MQVQADLSEEEDPALPACHLVAAWKLFSRNFSRDFPLSRIGQVYELSASEETGGDGDWLRETLWAPWRRVDYMNRTGILSLRARGEELDQQLEMWPHIFKNVFIMGHVKHKGE